MGKTAEIVRQRRTSQRYTSWDRISILKVNTYYLGKNENAFFRSTGAISNSIFRLQGLKPSRVQSKQYIYIYINLYK